MSNPGRAHWEAVKRIVRYLKGTRKHSICFGGYTTGDMEVRGFVDADWGGDLDNRKSTSGYIFKFYGGAISWMSINCCTIHH